MFPLPKEALEREIVNQDIVEITSATIRQIAALAEALGEQAGEEVVHLEMGNPGIPASRIGIEAGKAALDRGVPGTYPNIAGIPELKNAGSRFLKAFIDIDIPPRCIVPTVGSMQGSLTLLILMGQLTPGRDTIAYINPGFPAQRHQAKLLGLNQISFDLHSCRGAAIEDELRKMFETGRIAALIYSNPNNPAWTNLTEEELSIIGRLATEYGVIIIEDLAYMGMDFRRDLSHPGVAPFIPTVARYTDNYILLVSASKIFSYAGERIAMVCWSPALFDRRNEFCERFYEMPRIGDSYIFGVLYCCSSGTSHSAQYSMAAMLDAAADGRLDFVGDCREYGRRGERARCLFEDAGFHLVYDKDGSGERLSDGFFFTMGYPGLDSATLQLELLRYGISAISLPSTGSLQHGIRVCVSMLNNDETFDALGRRLQQFHNDHK